MSWTFAGVSFAVVSDGPIEPEWFAVKVERTVDAVAGSSTGKVYVDIGATVREPLSLVAQFTSAATRDALEALMSQSGTLADDDGRMATARLVAAVPIRVKKRGSGIYRLGVEFEWVS
jgi:hypothetical protein